MNLDSLAITHLLAVAAWLFWTIGPIAMAGIKNSFFGNSH